MTTLETIVLLITGIITLPFLCKLIRRQSLLYCTYLLLGLAVGSFLQTDTQFMLHELGKVGFLLLLFMIGLEIELPPFGTLRKSFSFCFLWLGLQIPICVFLSIVFGLGGVFGFVAAAGINACSLGIAYGITESQKMHFEPEMLKKILMAMVVLEVFSLFVLAMSEVFYKYGISFQVLSHGLGLVITILLIRVFSKPIHKKMSYLIEGVGIWKVHQLFLLLFAVSMIGERFGLAAQKTAFFLGLFMPSTTDSGIKVEDELKGIANGVLIPVFFISLGSRISLHNAILLFPIAIGITLLLFGIRFAIFKWKSGLKIPAKNFLLFCPNLTVVAVAAEILLLHDAPKQAVDLLLATGLLMTIGSAIMFPTRRKEPEVIPIKIRETSKIEAFPAEFEA